MLAAGTSPPGGRAWHGGWRNGDGGLRIGAGKLFLARAMIAPELTDQRFDAPPRDYRRGDRGRHTIHCQL